MLHLADPRPSVARRVIDWLVRVEAAIAALTALVLVLLITWGAAMRYVLRSPVGWVDEVSSFIAPIVVAFALAYTLRAGGHVNVELLTGKLDPKVQALLAVICRVLILAFGLLLLWASTKTTITSYQNGALSMTAKMPLYLGMLVIPLGFLAFCLEALLGFLPRSPEQDSH